MIIRWYTRIVTIVIREMGKRHAHGPISCTKEKSEKWLNLGHIRDRIYLTSIIIISSVYLGFCRAMQVIHGKDCNSKVCLSYYNPSSLAARQYRVANHRLWSFITNDIHIYHDDVIVQPRPNISSSFIKTSFKLWYVWKMAPTPFIQM